MKGFCIAALLAITATTTVSAQSTRDQQTSGSQTIERVIVRGNRRIPESDIRSWISAHKRGLYKPEELDRDVRALYASGHFTDVSVRAENGPRGGKIVTFEVMDRPLIFDIDFEGIDSTQRAQVLEELRNQKEELSRGSEYDPVRIKRAATIMEDLLTRSENRIVKVSPQIEQRTPTEVLIVFKVERGK